MRELLKEEEDQEEKKDQEAAAAILAQIFSDVDAEMIITKYPEAIPYAGELVERSTRWGVREPGAYALRLLESGWTPPRAEPRLPSLVDDPPGMASPADATCGLCGEPLAVCHGVHVPAWLVPDEVEA